ncbi:MAG: P-II family nitrogen regulator [Lachnospiraceae bacterium]|nr:P-II family nitrogen regulator [Lachnospira sp.]MBR6697528.1 P-II family nitrogen regulator [Lachnospiraceae bacterium]
MGNLFLMTTIIDRKDANKYIEAFKQNAINVIYTTLGIGTATSEVLDYLGMDTREKAVAYSVLEEDKWLEIKRYMEKNLKIDAPGGGISFTIPLSSIAGKRALQFLIEKQDYQKEEESTLKNTTHELIVVIAEQGYTQLIMNAARAAGAYGGTVIHAKGTGMEIAEEFMGVSLAIEKEILYIVTKTEQKNDIMKAIVKEAGIDSKAKAIAFSLPVTSTAGLRLIED